MIIKLTKGDIFQLEGDLHKYSGDNQKIETENYSDFKLLFSKKMDIENTELKAQEGTTNART